MKYKTMEERKAAAKQVHCDAVGECTFSSLSYFFLRMGKMYE